MEKVTRRGFLAGAGTTVCAAALAEEEKLTDGGLADVTPPGEPERKRPVLPAGARGAANLTLRCVGCQLCVNACPNNVLRTRKGVKGQLQVEMTFTRGWCRPECTVCGSVCPAGAIRPVSVKEKATIHVGHARWFKERCLAALDGIVCTVCERHCPAGAIVRVPLNPDDKKSPKIPVIDTLRCVGCGACEHLCPARPLPAMVVSGFEQHREVRPMGEADVLAEAVRLIELGKAGAVLVKDGVIVASAKGPGVKPLLQHLDTRPEELKGAWVIDKVIGRAAAAVIVQGGAARAYGVLMSDGAKAFLEKKGLRAEAKELVPQILNRTRDGLCPLEDAVKDLDEPGDMLKAIRARVKKLMAAGAAGADGAKKKE